MFSAWRERNSAKRIAIAESAIEQDAKYVLLYVTLTMANHKGLVTR